MIAMIRSRRIRVAAAHHYSTRQSTCSTQAVHLNALEALGCGASSRDPSVQPRGAAPAFGGPHTSAKPIERKKVCDGCVFGADTDKVADAVAILG
jgi:hypothetical protein